jgi:AAA family ATP:ADP antiporter
MPTHTTPHHTNPHHTSHTPLQVTWKSKLKEQFPNPNDYSAFMGNFSTATGAVTFVMMLISRFIFKYFGWGGAALITPTVLLATGES